MILTGCSSYWSACFTVMDVCHALFDDPASAECEKAEVDMHWIDVMVDVGFYIAKGFEDYHSMDINKNERRTVIKRESE